MLSKEIAKHLLQINAIKLSPAAPFTWASGWKSPIYCDNRKTLSYPLTRQFIRDSFVNMIKAGFPEANVIAGVATGAIAQGVLVAEALGLPFVYVRPEAKSHGLQNKVEGAVEEGQKVVVIEDLISTGGSSLKAVDALREAGCEVVGMVAIFSYGFEIAAKSFAQKDVILLTLGNYDDTIDLAQESGYISQSDVESLKQWRLSPATWGA